MVFCFKGKNKQKNTIFFADYQTYIPLIYSSSRFYQFPFDKKQLVAGFDARLEIDRLAYHVGNGKFYQMGVVGKDVDVLITLEVVRKK